MIHILTDRASAFWLPEALVAAYSDLAGLEMLLRERAILPRAASAAFPLADNRPWSARVERGRDDDVALGRLSGPDR
ncbi:hypothetical protein [Roseomonas populi]|uniref:Uncharacterized protein n=1 Tax=Roseomonas populi TaxID=3121582 RepID=A0ABT1XCA5_9PROT|nr:hypothetical protein [Roseomonas pecuniae]MCR0985730.1 hypothetical protein [Roseomonas pecuniae]